MINVVDYSLEIICIISKGHQLGQITCFEIERMSQERVVVRTHLSIFGIHFDQFFVVIEPLKLWMVEFDLSFFDKFSDAA